METIGERIKRLRKEKKITQKQIEEFCGISSGNISDIEHGKSLPSASAVIHLSKIFNCSTDLILLGGASNFRDFEDVTPEEYRIIVDFRSLSKNDQEELVEILKLKLKRSYGKKDLSSISETGTYENIS